MSRSERWRAESRRQRVLDVLDIEVKILGEEDRCDVGGGTIRVLDLDPERVVPGGQVASDLTPAGSSPPARADARLTAYAASTGDQAWQVALPGRPHVIAPISDQVVVVPIGTELHAIDAASGEAIWAVTMPSPGQVGSYSEPGTFWFIAGGDGTVAVAVGSAEQPYRD